MRIAAECPHCLARIGAKESTAGRIIRCPACGEMLQLPTLEEYHRTAKVMPEDVSICEVVPPQPPTSADDVSVFDLEAPPSKKTSKPKKPIKTIRHNWISVRQ